MLFAQGCEIAMDKDFPLYFKNNANHPVQVYLNDDENYVALYPDTLISESTERLGIVKSGKKARIAGGSGSWENIFEVSVPNDTLSLFVFHTDTLARYPWAEVQGKYKILKRYDLSLRDLERLDFTVTYPPDASMQGVKMYP